MNTATQALQHARTNAKRLTKHGGDRRVQVVATAAAAVLALQGIGVTAYGEALADHSRSLAEWSAQTAQHSPAETAAKVETAHQAQDLTDDLPAVADVLFDANALRDVEEMAEELDDDLAELNALTTAAPAEALLVSPSTFWGMFQGAGALHGQAAMVDAQRASITQLTESTETQAEQLQARAEDLYSTTGTRAAEFIGQHSEASNESIDDLEEAQEAVASQTSLTAAAVHNVRNYISAAQEVVSTDAEARRTLDEAKLEVHEFARSLSEDVRLDFVWVPLISGGGVIGADVGGYTEWDYSDPGRGTLWLSESVVETWPSEVSKSLVAHEVGHVVGTLCPELYDRADQRSIEIFATAWAIGKGFTADGNGESLYGTPAKGYSDGVQSCAP